MPRPPPSARPAVELLWPGKYGPDGLRSGALPSPPPGLTLVDHYPEPPDSTAAWRNLLVEGDSAHVAAALLPRHAATADLVYLDPPFDTGDRFTLSDGGAAYDDRWAETGDYLTFLDRLLGAAHALLAPRGTLWLHLDHRRAAHARLLLDERFGAAAWRNEVVWHYQTGGRNARAFARKHDTLLVYGKSLRPHFDADAVRVPRTSRRSHLRRGVDPDGRSYGEITSAGKVYRYYDDEQVVPDDVWSDLSALHQRDPERTGYPTQKPLALLDRIVRASCPPGGLVVDLGCGSGTALVAASRLARRWIGCDQSPAALALTERRLRADPATAPFDRWRLA